MNAAGKGGGENLIIDLNTADEETLARLPDIGSARARALVQHRPFKNWDEVKNLPEIGGHIVDILALNGVEIAPTAEDQTEH